MSATPTEPTNNRVEVTGDGTYWKATGGAGLADAADAMVPEPAAWALWIVGVACGVFTRRGKMHASFNRAANRCRTGA